MTHPDSLTHSDSVNHHGSVTHPAEAGRSPCRAPHLEVRGALDDAELSVLHARAFGGEPEPTPWTGRLQRHSLFWVTARLDGRLVGFVNVLGDGGAHAILLDTCVEPTLQGRGIGALLVERAAAEAAARGCAWLHADYEPDAVGFYEGRCGLRPTHAGLRRLSG